MDQKINGLVINQRLVNQYNRLHGREDVWAKSRRLIIKTMSYQIDHDNSEQKIKKSITELQKIAIKHIRKEWRKKFNFNPYICDLSLSGGCLTTNWKPDIMLFGIYKGKNRYLGKTEAYIIKRKIEWWCWKRSKFIKVEVPTQEIDDFCKLLSKQLGMRVYMYKHKPYEHDLENMGYLKKEQPKPKGMDGKICCGATIQFGDDFGDNPCTMVCKLPSGHEGKHKEVGNLSGNRPYEVTWEEEKK